MPGPIRSRKPSHCFISGDMPRPTMATSRPPGFSNSSACSTCLAPVSISFLSPMRGDRENGGFINTTLGVTRFAKMAFRCSAFSRCTGRYGHAALSKSARRSENSFATTPAIWFCRQAARAGASNEPVPAEGFQPLHRDRSNSVPRLPGSGAPLGERRRGRSGPSMIRAAATGQGGVAPIGTRQSAVAR